MHELFNPIIDSWWMFGPYRYKFSFICHDIAVHTHVGCVCNTECYALQRKRQQNHHQKLKNENGSL